MNRVLITGGAGFIGSNLADSLKSNGIEVRIFDNFSTGRREFVAESGIEIFEGDLRSDRDLLDKAVSGCDTVFHLAANADVRFGWDHPFLDLQQNVMATLEVADAARNAGVTDFVFSSTGSVYGEATVFPTPEDYGSPVQTSLYGASKISAEAFLAAFSTAGYFRSTVFRFVSVLGARYSHGHVIDFVKQLANDPSKLRILGDGTQTKSYMHVNDCIDAVTAVRSQSDFDVFNLGVPDTCQVIDSAHWIVSQMGVAPKLEFTGGSKGWVGDNPFILLDVEKAKQMGWTAKRSIESSVRDTVQWILSNPWILEKV